MIKIFLFLLVLPLIGQPHPGVGIVKDSKGNIYYTDLKQVWKIANGKKSVVVPNVHTHELYFDNNDNLYGEGGDYDPKTEKFYHYLWVYRPNGQQDTVIGMKEAYVLHDFSFAKDKSGNEYYLKRFLVPHTDTNHIYRKSPQGKETVFATGNFRNVNWLHPQNDGSLLYVLNNAIYKVDSLGNIQIVKEQVANLRSSTKTFWNNILVWGVWQDNAKHVYAAVLSDQSVKKIDPYGRVSDIYKSEGNWTPLHGVFDNDNKLWVLESSDKNDIRVTLAETSIAKTNKRNNSRSNLLPLIIGGFVLSIVIFYLTFRDSDLGLRRLKS